MSLKVNPRGEKQKRKSREKGKSWTEQQCKCGGWEGGQIHNALKENKTKEQH